MGFRLEDWDHSTSKYAKLLLMLLLEGSRNLDPVVSTFPYRVAAPFACLTLCHPHSQSRSLDPLPDSSFKSKKLRPVNGEVGTEKQVPKIITRSIWSQGCVIMVRGDGMGLPIVATRSQKLHCSFSAFSLDFIEEDGMMRA